MRILSGSSSLIALSVATLACGGRGAAPTATAPAPTASSGWPSFGAARSPACASTDHRGFDFWLGAWEVTDPTGKAVIGHNDIVRDLGGCALVESWVGTEGDHGRSINYWDAAARRWQQHWVDEGGRIVDFAGGLRGDGAMALQGKSALVDGTSFTLRMTFTPNPDGTVRQLIERSTDDGVSWKTSFDGLYRRVGTPAAAAATAAATGS